ncbi:MAG: selenium-binding protein SBP56-related protein [Vicinamibacterales bacterium]
MLDRRCLVVPGTRSSRIHVIDTRPDPSDPRVVKVIEPDVVAQVAGYRRPTAVRCGAGHVMVSALEGMSAGDPGGVLALDAETFDLRGPWELDRGPQTLGGELGWHPTHDSAVSGEWGPASLLDEGIDAARLRARGYGRHLHVWRTSERAHARALDLDPDGQLLGPVRPLNHPARVAGFAALTTSARDWSATVHVWERTGRGDAACWSTAPVIAIPGTPAGERPLPAVLDGVGAVPPLVTDLALSLDDRWLYVACWGTGELRQYDVTCLRTPRLTGVLHLGGIARDIVHRQRPDAALEGGPCALQLSRDGRRLYVTNSMGAAWDRQFHPPGVRGWMARVEIAATGEWRLDDRFLVALDGWRPHGIRLEGGDAASDSYCYA